MRVATTTRPAVAVSELVKVYGTGETAVRALDGVSVAFGAGRFTAIMGPSGSGKATLMHCAAGPDVVFADEPTGNLDSRAGQQVAASFADRVVLLADGRDVGEILDPTPDSVLDRLKHPGG